MQFLTPEKQYNDPKSAKFVVIPVAYEGTVSYGKGASAGPKAIIAASEQVEKFDEELLVEAYKEYGIFTAKEIRPKNQNAKAGEAVRIQLGEQVKTTLTQGQTPVILGGEHSITSAAVKEIAKKFPNMSVLQIDAHADLRQSYQGSTNSHACAMRRVLESAPVVQVGIRNISKEEYEFAQQSGQLKKIHFAHELNKVSSGEERKAVIDKILNQLTGEVYITIDVDGLDPSIMPSTGTPEPNGLHWSDLVELVKECTKKKKIVGFDVVELAPVKGVHAPDFLCAKLIYKIMSYIANGKRA